MLCLAAHRCRTLGGRCLAMSLRAALSSVPRCRPYTECMHTIAGLITFPRSSPKRSQFPKVFDKTFIPLTSYNLFTFSHYSFQLSPVSICLFAFRFRVALESNFLPFLVFFFFFALALLFWRFVAAQLATWHLARRVLCASVCRVCARARACVSDPPAHTHFYLENVLSS